MIVLDSIKQDEVLIMANQPELTRPQETADALKISIATLYRWRKMRDFPQPLTMGKVVFYDVAAIRAWLAIEGEPLSAISARAMQSLDKSSKQ